VFFLIIVGFSLLDFLFVGLRVFLDDFFDFGNSQITYGLRDSRIITVVFSGALVTCSTTVGVWIFSMFLFIADYA